jgi:hypothetical protein
VFAAALEKTPEVLDADDAATLTALLEEAGATNVSVTSDERTVEHQTRVMFELVKKDLNEALAMYCAEGDEVLRRYDAKLSREENLKRMQAELELQLPKARERGCLNHVQNDAVYSVHVAEEAVPEEKRKQFVSAALKAVRAGKIARFSANPESRFGYHFEFAK